MVNSIIQNKLYKTFCSIWRMKNCSATTIPKTRKKKEL
jgi:hypothetical protein